MTEIESSEFRYWAFLSYSSKDAKAARRLHQQLEKYGIPRDLVGRPGRDGPVPRKLFPIFRDREELPLSSDLGGTINDALRASRYLIVICSPHAAKSRWVNEEIRFFKSLGRSDRILALMVDGEPNAEEPGEECFPPALRFEVDGNGEITDRPSEPIAGDARRGGQDGWQRAFVKAVAGITGLGFDAFMRRERKRARRKAVLRAAAVLTLLLGGAAWWDFERLKVAHFAEVTERWGVPEGVVRLSSEEVSHREVSYRVESRRYRVRRVSRVNSAGMLKNSEEGHRAATQEVVYREGGQVDALILRDFNGKVVLRKEFQKLRERDGRAEQYVDLRTEFQDAPASLQAAFGNVVGEGVETQWRSSITAYRFVYGEAGLVDEEYFTNAYRAPKSNQYGIFGKAYRYDDRGLIVEETYLGPEGEPAFSKKGIQRERFKRGRRGEVLELTYLGRDGELMRHPDGFAKRVSTYDRWGNNLTRSSFSADGDLTLNKDGVAVVRYVRDDAGNIVEWFHLGTDEEPILGTFGNAGGRSRYDRRGNEVERLFFDTEGEPARIKEGYVRHVAEYDDRGNLIARSYFGFGDEPTLHKDGMARFEAVFDEKGNQVRESYYDGDGNPALRKLGYHRQEVTFDERGLPVAYRFHGTDGNLILSGDGVAGWDDHFDERGNLVEQVYIGLDGEPGLNKKGFSRLKQSYDDRGNLIELRVFDSAGNPVLSDDRSHREVRFYDDRGNRTGSEFYGLENQPTVHKKGYFGWEQKFDSKGNIVEWSFVGIDGKPVAGEDGFATGRARFDDRGLAVEMSHYDAKGQPCNHREGYFRVTSKYDELGRTTERAFYETGGNLTLREGNYALETLDYDVDGWSVVRRYFGVNREPVLHKLFGAVEKSRLDAMGRKVEAAFFDETGNPVPGDTGGVPRWVSVYDARGNLTEQSFYGADGELTLRDWGIARMRAIFDDRDQLVEMQYLGTDGRETAAIWGASRIKLKYDERGNRIEMMSYGPDGKAVLNRIDGIYGQRDTFDERNRHVGRTFLGPDGKPFYSEKFGFASMEATLDERGNPLEKRYFDASGKPTKDAQGAAVLKAKFNELGLSYDISAFDERGEPCVAAGLGCARAVFEYDERRRARKATHYDDQGTIIGPDRPELFLAIAGGVLGDGEDFYAPELIEEMVGKMRAIPVSDPFFVDARRKLAEFFRKKGNKEGYLRATKELTAVLEAKLDKLSGEQRALRVAELGKSYSSQAFQLLKFQEFQAALSAARRAFELLPEVWVEGNLAHALLLTGDFEQARAIYLRNRGKQLENSNANWEVATLIDFNAFRQSGVRHPDMEKIEALLRGTP